MAAKKKVQKMSLSDFLADETTGSWADEMAAMPAAPSGDARDSGYSSRGFGGESGDRFGDLPRGPASRDGGYDGGDRYRSDRGYGGFGGDRESRPYRERPPVELPTQPPFTAHVANLSFDAEERDLADFFGNLKISNIRVLKDRDDKPKGFGYVEFDDIESLKSALDMTGEQLLNRPIRVNIAEPRERDSHGFRDEKTNVDNWRRTAPVEVREPPRGGFGGDRGSRSGWGERRGFEAREGGFERRERDLDNRPRDTSWSGGAFTSYRGGIDRQEPASRPKLDLKPRSTANVATASDSQPKSNKPNPFGAAKPIDSDEAIRRVEQRRKEREEAKKKEKEAAAKDSAAKPNTTATPPKTQASEAAPVTESK